MQQEKTLTVRIPVDLDKRIELCAAESGKTKRDVVVAALEQKFGRRK